MEVSVEPVAGHNGILNDTFLSLRVGSSQKQGRLGATRVFKFSQDVQDPQARVEIFRRIGAATVALSSQTGKAHEVDVKCVGAEQLRLRLAVNARGGDLASTQELKTQRVKERADAAQTYIERHNLEGIMAEAMKEVIRTRPDVPHKFLADKILALGGIKEDPKDDPFGQAAGPSPVSATAEATEARNVAAREDDPSGQAAESSLASATAEATEARNVAAREDDPSGQAAESFSASATAEAIEAQNVAAREDLRSKAVAEHDASPEQAATSEDWKAELLKRDARIDALEGEVSKQNREMKVVREKMNTFEDMLRKTFGQGAAGNNSSSGAETKKDDPFRRLGSVLKVRSKLTKNRAKGDPEEADTDYQDPDLASEGSDDMQGCQQQ